MFLGAHLSFGLPRRLLMICEEYCSKDLLDYEQKNWNTTPYLLEFINTDVNIQSINFANSEVDNSLL